MLSLKPVGPVTIHHDSSWVPTPLCMSHVIFLCLSVSQRHAQIIGSGVAKRHGQHSHQSSTSPWAQPQWPQLQMIAGNRTPVVTCVTYVTLCDTSAHVDIDRNHRPPCCAMVLCLCCCLPGEASNRSQGRFDMGPWICTCMA